MVCIQHISGYVTSETDFSLLQFTINSKPDPGIYPPCALDCKERRKWRETRRGERAGGQELPLSCVDLLICQDFMRSK